VRPDAAAVVCARAAETVTVKNAVKKIKILFIGPPSFRRAS
jgi:hypothetical protein